jgi:hypothetical protein
MYETEDSASHDDAVNVILRIFGNHLSDFKTS